MKPRTDHHGNLIVLSLIGGGLLAILLSIIAGLFFSKGSASLPNWAENVLVMIASTCALKLGDVLNTLVALASGRQVESLGRQLASSSPGEQASGKAGDPLHVTPELKSEDIPLPTFGQE